MRRRVPPSVETIRARLRQLLPDLQIRYGVRALWLFGSYARGTARPHSDLDILVEFDERPLTLVQFVALEQELSDWLGVKVDLVEKKALKPLIRSHILQEAIPI